MKNGTSQCCIPKFDVWSCPCGLKSTQQYNARQRAEKSSTRYNSKIKFQKNFLQSTSTWVVLDQARYLPTTAALSSGVASSNLLSPTNKVCFLSSCCSLTLWLRRYARRSTASTGLSRRWAVTSSSFTLKHPGSAEPTLAQGLLLCCTLWTALWNEHIRFCSLSKTWQLLSCCRWLYGKRHMDVAATNYWLGDPSHFDRQFTRMPWLWTFWTELFHRNVFFKTLHGSITSGRRKISSEPQQSEMKGLKEKRFDNFWLFINNFRVDGHFSFRQGRCQQDDWLKALGFYAKLIPSQTSETDAVVMTFISEQKKMKTPGMAF